MGERNKVCSLKYTENIAGLPRSGYVEIHTSTSSTIGNVSELLGKTEIDGYVAVFPDMVRDLTDFGNGYESKVAAEWFERALHYNVSLGDTKNSVIAALTYKNLVKGDQLTADNLRLAHLLDWCRELLHACIFITDDIMDKSINRRDQLCWYKFEEVGFNALNDALMIENALYKVLQKNFRHLDCYANLVELFCDIAFNYYTGQTMDMLGGRFGVKSFTREFYAAISKTKTAINCFYLPVTSALHLANVKDPKVFSECEIISIELGNFYQAQNDYLDCFANPDFTGKIGTDIEANKCTWLSALCMELANPKQKSIMEECYGYSDPEKVARIKQLYEELNIPSLYAKHEKETYNRLKTLIQQASVNVPREALEEVLNAVNRRGII